MKKREEKTLSFVHFLSARLQLDEHEQFLKNQFLKSFFIFAAEDFSIHK